MLFEIARSLRSLTRSPIEPALHAARSIARPRFRFEEGGVIPHEGRVDQKDEHEYELPGDIDPMQVALAIDESLRHGRKVPGLGDDPMQLLERRVGRPVVVAGHHLLRLGDGNFAKGKRFMHRLVARLRQRRH